MDRLEGMKHRFAWVALALALFVPSGFASGWTWLLSHGERACVPSTAASCASFDLVDASHCHCLQTPIPATGVPVGWSVPSVPSPDLAMPRELPRRVVAEERPPRARAVAVGPPPGCPYAARTGLTLYA